MSLDLNSVLRSGFLQGPNGPLHLSIFTPPPGEAPRHWVVHVPPFAEEMNKCRPMVARQARRLADEGAVVLVPDLFGTGDSAGEFQDASWSCWQADLDYLRSWCLEQGAGEVILWGVRLGCLLALDSLRRDPVNVSGLLLWQPVLAGALHLNQFLRLRTASGMMQGESESVSDLRQRFNDGESVEVAGYLLSPRLYDSVAAASVADMAVPPGCTLSLYELVSDAEKPLLPVTVKQLERWCENNDACHGATVAGSPFWLTQEIGFAPALIEESSRFLRHLPSCSDAVAPLEMNLPVAIQQGDSGSVTGMVFPCGDEQLLGQLHQPAPGSAQPGDAGVLIVVGGPQYRVGSHRQFQQLAASLCAGGLPVLRFDYRGMGDSSGELRGFTAVDDDIRAAIDAFVAACPGVKRVVLWGLCDAATASAFYARHDSRVAAMVLANPWVYSVQGEAKAFLKHYYRDRLFSRDLWRKILRGEFDIRGSLSSIAGFLRSALGAAQTEQAALEDSGVSEKPDTDSQEIAPSGADADFVAAFTAGLREFSGETLFIISGNDLTAAEFMDAASNSDSLRACMGDARAQMLELEDADHTFSRRVVSERVEEATLAFARRFL